MDSIGSKRPSSRCPLRGIASPYCDLVSYSMLHGPDQPLPEFMHLLHSRCETCGSLSRCPTLHAACHRVSCLTALLPSLHSVHVTYSGDDHVLSPDVCVPVHVHRVLRKGDASSGDEEFQEEQRTAVRPPRQHPQVLCCLQLLPEHLPSFQ